VLISSHAMSAARSSQWQNQRRLAG